MDSNPEEDTQEEKREEQTPPDEGPSLEPPDEPLQLIEFVENKDTGRTVIQLNPETIDRVFKSIGDHLVSVICVAGPSRQGKSFLLGYFIRCLGGLEEGKADWMGWDDRKNPLKGFKFRGGITPETKGIWVWSRPFIIANRGKKVAVLLLDTQGTHDEFTTNKDMSAIVGLSLLTSSVMIFNSFTNVQEDVLLALNTYIQYGTLALGEGSGTPFQKLNFLIREWNSPWEYPYGGKGGELFLEERLKFKDRQSQEARHVRETIQKCFEELDCFLMPSIGDKAKKPNFTGSIDELLPSFAKELENFINNLVINKGLPVKHILGSQISASALKSCLETYVDIFNSDEVPKAETMWQATSQISNSNVIEKALKVYDTYMKNKLGDSYLQIEEIEMEHSIANQLALDHFKHAKKYGSKDTISEFEEKLGASIQNKFSEIKKQNEDKRTEIVALEIGNAQSQFRSELSSAFPFEDLESTEFYVESVIRGVADKAGSTILEHFRTKFFPEPDGKLAGLVKIVKDNFESSLISFMNQNEVNRGNAEREMNVTITELSADHQSKLESYMSLNDFEENEVVIQKTHDSIKAATVQLFHGRKKPGGEDFREEFLQKLRSQMENTFTNLKNHHKFRIQNALQLMEKSITVYCKQYEAEVKEGGEHLDEGLLENIHSRVEPTYIKKFHEEVNPFSKQGRISQKLERKMKEQLHQVFEKFKSKIAEEKQRCLDSYKKAAVHAFTYYKGKMDCVMYSTALISDEALEAGHSSSRMGAIEEFEKFEKFGRPANLPELKSDLMQKMDRKWGQIINDNRNKWKLAISKAESLVGKCKHDYKILMKTEMDKMLCLEQLQSSHEKSKVVAMETLRQTSPLSGTPKFEESKEELEKKIEEAFEKLKKEEHSALRDVLIEVRKIYHDKMGEYCKDHLVMKPTYLKSIHGLVKEAVIQECRKKFQISNFRLLGVEVDLHELFGIYSMRNDMNFNDGDMGVPPAIGIDLGTTYSCVSVSYKGKVHIIPNFEEGFILTTPSYVAFHPDGSETFGEVAKVEAYKNPEFTIYDAKRIIGRKITDETLQDDMKLWPFEVKEDGGVPKVAVNGRLLHPEHISGRLLAKCREMAEAFLRLPPGTIRKAVITVPAYFNDGQRQATVDAGKLANLEVLKILNEPTAAAIAYSLQRLDKEPKKILIYDLGGGTFDVPESHILSGLFRFEGGTVGKLSYIWQQARGRVVAHMKNAECETFVIIEFGPLSIRKHFTDSGKDSGVKQERDVARRRLTRLQEKCEAAKKKLSSAQSTVVDADAIINGVDLSVKVTRAEFEEMNLAYFEESMRLVEGTLMDVGLRKEDIDDVVLVGGSSRIPKVQKMLKKLLDKQPNKSIHPDLAVAYGAAVQAALMNGRQAKGNIDFTHIRDVTPMSLGIEVVTKDLSVILPKNTQIPTKQMKVHYTVEDNQTRVQVKVYQGEDLNIAANNKLLGVFDLNGIPPKKKREEPIDVWMEINSMGILHVKAICRSTEGENSVTVHENKMRMSDEEIRSILEEEAASANNSKKEADETPQEDDITTMIMESMQINLEEYNIRVVTFKGPHFTRDYRDIQQDLANFKSELEALDVTGRSNTGIQKREALIQVDRMIYTLAGKVHEDGKCCKLCELGTEE